MITAECRSEGAPQFDGFVIVHDVLSDKRRSKDMRKHRLLGGVALAIGLVAIPAAPAFAQDGNTSSSHQDLPAAETFCRTSSGWDQTVYEAVQSAYQAHGASALKCLSASGSHRDTGSPSEKNEVKKDEVSTNNAETHPYDSSKHSVDEPTSTEKVKHEEIPKLEAEQPKVEEKKSHKDTDSEQVTKPVKETRTTEAPKPELRECYQPFDLGVTSAFVTIPEGCYLDLTVEVNDVTPPRTFENQRLGYKNTWHLTTGEHSISYPQLSCYEQLDGKNGKGALISASFVLPTNVEGTGPLPNTSDVRAATKRVPPCAPPVAPPAPPQPPAQFAPNIGWETPPVSCSVSTAVFRVYARGGNVASPNVRITDTAGSNLPLTLFSQSLHDGDTVNVNIPAGFGETHSVSLFVGLDKVAFVTLNRPTFESCNPPAPPVRPPAPPTITQLPNTGASAHGVNWILVAEWTMAAIVVIFLTLTPTGWAVVRWFFAEGSYRTRRF